MYVASLLLGFMSWRIDLSNLPNFSAHPWQTDITHDNWHIDYVEIIANYCARLSFTCIQNSHFKMKFIWFKNENSFCFMFSRERYCHSEPTSGDNSIWTKLSVMPFYHGLAVIFKPDSKSFRQILIFEDREKNKNVYLFKNHDYQNLQIITASWK